MSFDRIVQMGSRAACMYDVDVGAVHTEEEARRVLAATRVRVRHGRGLRPDAAHYVNLRTSGGMDAAVSDVLLPALGAGDGIDSVAVEGLACDAGPDFSAVVGSAGALRDAVKDLGAGWSKVVDAFDADADIEGTVVGTDGDSYLLDAHGAIGTLPRSGRALGSGDKVRVRVVVLNVGRRILVFAPSPQ